MVFKENKIKLEEKFRIPFVFFPLISDKLSTLFLGIGNFFKNRNKNFSLYFSEAEIKIKPEKYFAIVLASAFINFIFLSLIFCLIFFIGQAKWFFGLIISLIFVLFMFIQQINYPRLLALRKIRNIEVNLLPALRTISVQLDAGVTFFNAIKNIADSNYGAISEEFKKAVNEIEAGRSAIDVLEELSKNNPSLFFRRAIWQIVTGMRVGADISEVLKEIVKSLVQEQISEIQAYGSKLSPMSMFYMVIAIIFPALSITFILVLSSFIQILGQNYKTILFFILGTVIFLQIMFLGVIKSGRPNLL